MFGSFSKGLQNSGSDVDIAVFLKGGRRRRLYESGLSLEIEGALENKREADVRVLNGQPLAFAFQVVKYGKRIFTRDRRLAVNYEASLFCRYFDFQPVLKAYDRAQSRRILA